MPTALSSQLIHPPSGINPWILYNGDCFKQSPCSRQQILFASIPPLVSLKRRASRHPLFRNPFSGTTISPPISFMPTALSSQLPRGHRPFRFPSPARKASNAGANRHQHLVTHFRAPAIPPPISFYGDCFKQSAHHLSAFRHKPKPLDRLQWRLL